MQWATQVNETMPNPSLPAVQVRGSRISKTAPADQVRTHIAYHPHSFRRFARGEGGGQFTVTYNTYDARHVEKVRGVGKSWVSV